MLLPIIDAIIQDVNRLSGDVNLPGFEEDLASCIFVMENETNPDALCYKFLMLEISLPNLHRILTYFSTLQLRADSLQDPEGEPINKTALILAIKAITIAIEKEGEPLELSWKKVKNSSEHPGLVDLTSSVEDTSHSNLPRPSTSTSNASTTKAAKRSSSKLNSRGTGAKTIAVEVPGTSQQIKIKHCSSASDSNPSDDSSPVKQMSRLAPPKAKTVRPTTKTRGRHPSMSSVSSATPSSSSPFSPTSPFSPISPPIERPLVTARTTPTQLSPRTPLPQLEPLLDPALLSPESRHATLSSSLSPSTSTRTPMSLLEPPFLESDSRQGNISLSASTSSVTSSTTPTYGLIVTFVVPVSIPIQQGLVRVLDPYRNRIETTPICGNHIFIKLKDKKDIYFLKRQIEILTRLSPRIVVTTFWRYQIEVIKKLSPTIKEFVNFNAPSLKGEYYVYSRALSQDCDNIIVFEVLADAQCRRSLENASYQLRIGVETRTAVLVDSYKECNRCFFCYDDAHSECSNAVLMTEVPEE